MKTKKKQEEKCKCKCHLKGGNWGIEMGGYCLKCKEKHLDKSWK